MDLVIAIVAALAAGAVGFFVGRSAGHGAGLAEGRAEAEGRLRTLIDAVKRGRTPRELRPGSAEAELQAALEQGWTPREVERAAALREAVGRVGAFLDSRVRRPLSGYGPGAGRDELDERIERALGALQDLDFFMSEARLDVEGTNLVTLVQGVSREFASDQGVGVRLLLDESSVRANVSPSALMDALYLVLHNAGRFGRGATIDLAVRQSNGRALIVVRDRGEGFSEEAFVRAFDPFYSTSPDGLGLGLPHVRRVVEEMGGAIELRNVPDGGAEVEISFPAS